MPEQAPSPDKCTLAAVEEQLTLKSWWAALMVLPLANRLVVLTITKTTITPNQITFVSVLLRLGAAASFLGNSHGHLLAGAGCYYLAYLLDCVDGPVARLTGASSEFGRYFDHLSDLVGDLLILLCLAHGQGLLATQMVAAMVFAHLAEYAVSYLTSSLLRLRNGIANPNPAARLVLLQPLLAWRTFCFSRNFKSFVSLPDYEALVFIVFPVLGLPDIGLATGFWLVLMVVTYTIFSSFLTVVLKGTQFP